MVSLALFKLGQCRPPKNVTNCTRNIENQHYKVFHNEKYAISRQLDSLNYIKNEFNPLFNIN